MPAQKGKDLLIKIADGAGGFVTVAGLRTRQLAFNAEAVDVTNAESAGRWRELLGEAGVRRAAVTGAGVFKDETSDARLRQVFFDGAIESYEIVVPDFGRIAGPFQITALEYRGDHAGEVTFEMAFESAGAADVHGAVSKCMDRSELAVQAFDLQPAFPERPVSRVIEDRVAQHYTHGELERAILDAVVASGKDPERLAPADLGPVDEFHVGGRQATTDFAAYLPFRDGSHLLDIGSGLGGGSRYFADARGCRVTGIDLTEEYVRTAEALARRVGLSERVFYRQGSALELPFTDRSFDGAYMLHVGMNIEDKGKLFAEVARVLKPAATFGIYDIMRIGEGELAFPVPWAASPETSFLHGPADYRRLLEGAGFTITHERSRRDFAIAFFNDLRARAAASGGPPPLGLQILMGQTAGQKVANMIANIEGGLIAPTELVARAS